MRKIKIIRKYPLVILVIFFSIIGIIKFLGIVINITPSMKKGIYAKTTGEIKAGDIVYFCLEDHYRTIGLERNYIVRGNKCNDAEPLFKQVFAIPGDNVILSDQNIVVNGIKYSYPTQHTDSAGRILNVYPRGEYFNTSGYWLIGVNAPNSWDSRYFGPIKQNQILYKVKPLLTW